MKSTPWILPLGLALLTGCAVVVPATSSHLSPGPAQRASIRLQPQLLASRHVQAVIPLYTPTSIATLSVTPYVEVDTGVFRPLLASTGEATDSTDATILYQATQASPSIDLTKTVVLGNLFPNKTYRVIIRAYDAGNALISTDASSSVDLFVIDDERPAMGTLPLKLNDRSFAGATTVTLKRLGGTDYDHLALSFVRIQGSTEVPVSTSSIEGEFNNQLLSLGKLAGNTTYRVKAEAQAADDAFIASGSVDIVVSDDDAPATQSLTITLPADG